jgi:hypothetical protein
LGEREIGMLQELVYWVGELGKGCRIVGIAVTGKRRLSDNTGWHTTGNGMSVLYLLSLEEGLVGARRKIIRTLS